jgi:carbon monoxide dehydrogenase subunit G
MATVERTFTVTASPAAVLAYLKDFGHAERWDPGTESCTRTDSGPVAVGSTWRNRSKIFGISTELIYTLRELADDRVVFVGENDTATSIDTIAVRPSGSGSELTYHAEVAMHGFARLADPVVRLAFEKLAGDTEKQMTRVLNLLPEAL